MWSTAPGSPSPTRGAGPGGWPCERSTSTTPPPWGGTSAGAGRRRPPTGGARFGATMVEACRASAGGLAHARPRAADLLYYGGTAADVPGVVKRDIMPCPRQMLMATDAVVTSPLLSRVPAGTFACPVIRASAPAARGILITSATEDLSQLPASGQGFVRAFHGRYGHSPGRYAAYG